MVAERQARFSYFGISLRDFIFYYSKMRSKMRKVAVVITVSH